MQILAFAVCFQVYNSTRNNNNLLLLMFLTWDLILWSSRYNIVRRPRAVSYRRRVIRRNIFRLYRVVTYVINWHSARCARNLRRRVRPPGPVGVINYLTYFVSCRSIRKWTSVSFVHIRRKIIRHYYLYDDIPPGHLCG